MPVNRTNSSRSYRSRETAPLLPVTRGSSSRRSSTVEEVSLRTSRSPFLQRADSCVTGLKSKAKVEQASASSSGVYVDSDSSDSFKLNTDQALNRLSKIPTGRATIRQIDSLHTMYPEKRVVITPSQKPNSATVATWHAPKSIQPNFTYRETVVARPTGDPFMPWVAGRGADSAVIIFNDQQGHDYSRDPHRGKPDSAYSFVTLGHELIHASHVLHGNQYNVPLGNPACDSDNPAAEEELRTTGVGPWRDEPLSENAMRRELGLPERASYCGNEGTRLRPPPEQNSRETERRIAALRFMEKKPK